jgi:uncharacterized protein YjlB
VTDGAPQTLSLQPDDAIPNSVLPVLIYRGLELAGDPSSAERGFSDNGWWDSWRDGIYPFHHFHSTAHEVLAIVAGHASVALGGPHGETVAVERGDVVVLPAGTGHCNQGASQDLLVVGAYPQGMDWDLRRGDPAEYDQVVGNVAAVPLPGSDPVHGPDGPLTRLWPAAR